MQTQASVPSVRKRLFYTNIYTEIENQKKKKNRITVVRGNYFEPLVVEMYPG